MARMFRTSVGLGIPTGGSGLRGGGGGHTFEFNPYLQRGS